MRGDESAIMTYYNEICNKNESFEETNDQEKLCNDFGPWVWANGIQYFHDYNKRLVIRRPNKLMGDPIFSTKICHTFFSTKTLPKSPPKSI